MIDPVHVQILEPGELAAALEQVMSAWARLASLVDALVERLAFRNESLEFDAGVDLLDYWIGDPETVR